MRVYSTVPPASEVQEQNTWAEKTAAVIPINLPTLLREFEVGANYQKSLLSKVPDVRGYDVCAFNRAAHLLSGDYFDCFPLSGGRLGLLVADATGKGLSGALIASAFRAIVRNLPKDRYEKPPLFIRHANQLLLRAIRRGVFVSALYGVLNPEKNTITIANAGHLPMLVYHTGRGRVAAYAQSGPVLGVLSGRQYEGKIKEETVALSARDRLLMFTDGINEAKAPSQLDFGFSHVQNRLIRDAGLSCKQVLRNIVDEVDIHRSGWEQSDDITLVAAQRLK